MADSTLQVNINGRDNLSPVVQNIESKLIRFVGAVSSAVAAIRVATFPVAAAGNFERELANVKKTTEFSTEQIGRLGAELEKLSLRMNVSAVDLAKISAAAGQQGLGTLGPEGIALFTESVSRMSSVLDISAEDAANSVGKIINIFKVSTADIEKIVSGFNEASNNSTASGEELLDVVRRIGDAAGTINLQESLGLAATGIDFGMSPEVVGTSYGKIFADMRAKAEDFAALMQTTTNEWITRIDTKGGIEVYKDYLARLRQLNSADQAKAISELSGRGRIFALVNKNVQDTQNRVLDRNLAFAAEGFESGTSAIREQQTVLETLNEQYVILKNSIFSLSTEAGDQMLAPLTAYVAQLSAALQKPAVRSFVEAIGKSMVELIEVFAAVLQSIASWNVNWENLIAVAKIFIGIKLAEAIGGIAARITILGQSYNSLTAQTRAAAAGISAANAASSAGSAGQLTGLRAVLALWAQRAQAVRAATAAEELHTRAVANNNALETQLRNAASNDRNKQRISGLNGLWMASSQAAVQQAQAQAAQNAAVIEQKRDAKLADAKQKHQQNITAIEQSFAGKRSAIDRANKQALIEAEDRHLARVTASTNSYYARRLTAAAAADAQLIAQEQATLARRQQMHAQAEAARLAAAGQTARARALLERSDAEVRRTADNLRNAEQAAQRAGRAFFNFGTLLAGAVAAVRFALSAFMSLFLWATLLYTALDAFGLLDNVSAWFTKLTDAVGLTSEAKRKAAQASKDHQKELEEEKQRVKELAEEYQKLIDKSTGLVDAKKLDGIGGTIKSGGEDAQRRGLGIIGDALIASGREANQTSGQAAKGLTDLTEATIKVDQLKKKLAELRDIDSKAGAQGWRERANEIEDYRKRLTQAEATLKSLQSIATTSTKELTETAKANRAELEARVGSLFTAESAKLYQDHIVRIRNEQQALQDLTKKRQEAAQAENEVKNDPAKLEVAKAATAQLDAEMVKLNLKIADMQKAFKTARDAIMNDKGIPQAIKDSVAFLSQFLELRTEVVNEFNKTLNGRNQNSAPLTGSNVPAAPPKDTGDDAATNGEKQESEARKRARARLQLEKAQSEAIAALQRERNKQTMEAEEFAYKEGLRGIEEYYARRKQLLLANNKAEQDALTAQIKIAQRERSDRAAMGAETSELLRFDTDIARLRGEIAVLREQRKGIATDAQADVAEAYDALANRINATNLSIAEQLGVTDVDRFFAQNLQAYNEQYSEFFRRLEKDGGEAGEKLAKSLRAAGGLDALGKVMNVMAQETERGYTELDNYVARLNILRDAGTLTTAEFEERSARARAALASQVRAELEAQEAALARLGATADTSSKAYKDIAASIDASKLRLQELQSVANQVAVGINQSISSAIQQALTTLTNGSIDEELSDTQRRAMSDNDAAINRLRDNIGFLERARDGVISGYDGQNSVLDAQIAKSRAEIERLSGENDRIQQKSRSNFLDTLAEAARGFGINIAKALQEAATKNLAEQAMRSLNSVLGGAGAGGGVGGMIANLLSPTSAPGASPINPMFVSDVTGGAGAAVDAVLQGKDNQLVKMWDSFAGKGAETFTKLKEGFGNTFDGLAKGLSSILSSLFSSSNSGWFSSAASAVGSYFGSFHTGGVVGSSMQPRFAYPAVFANAVRYHTGGIAGLAPDEVPAILRRGEEVLTEGDPRHRANMGGSGDVNIKVDVNVESGTTSVEGDNESARQLGQVIASVVQQELVKQKRPGGLLNE